MTKKYNLENIRTLLIEGYSEEELRELCFDEFKPLYHHLPIGASKGTIAQRLIEYADQKLQLDKLLDWAKAHNPVRYEKHQPYYSFEPDTPAESKIAIEDTKIQKASPTTNDFLKESCPATLGDLIQKDPTCAHYIQREELLREIKEFLTNTTVLKPNHVILYGQPMIGKTKILNRLAAVLSDEYIPLMVTGQGLNAVDNLDAFALDLADQLINRFQKWIKLYDVRLDLDKPNWSDFAKGKGRRSFHQHWDHLRRIAGEKKPVVIFDEIEHLLDDPKKLNPHILTFLDDFIRNPDNGFFILAGSERIRHSENKDFSMLIAKGRPIRVRHYDHVTVTSVFSAIQHYFAFEEDALQFCLNLCDGHPRLLQILYEVVVFHAIRSPGKQKVEKRDIELIQTQVIEQADEVLWALLKRLNAEEKTVIKLISRKNDLEYSLQDLATSVKTQPAIDSEYLSKGIDDLIEREWLEWKNKDRGLFRFKLGIFPLWLRRNYINLDQRS